MDSSSGSGRELVTPVGHIDAPAPEIGRMPGFSGINTAGAPDGWRTSATSGPGLSRARQQSGMPHPLSGVSRVAALDAPGGGGRGGILWRQHQLVPSPGFVGSRVGNDPDRRFNAERTLLPPSSAFGIEAGTSNEGSTNSNVYMERNTGLRATVYDDGSNYPASLTDSNINAGCRRNSSSPAEGDGNNYPRGNSSGSDKSRENSSSSSSSYTTGGGVHGPPNRSQFSCIPSPVGGGGMYTRGSRNSRSGSNSSSPAGGGVNSPTDQNSSINSPTGDSGFNLGHSGHDNSSMGGGGEGNNTPRQDSDIRASASGHITSSNVPPAIDISSGSLRQNIPAPTGGGEPGLSPEECKNGDGGGGVDDEDGGGGGDGTRISLMFKLILLRIVARELKKDRDSPVEVGAPWGWKGTPGFWILYGKKWVEEALKAWMELSVVERTKYGGPWNSTNTLTQGTSKQFLSKMNSDYHKNKNTTSSSATGRFWRDVSPVMAAIINMESVTCNDDGGVSAVRTSTAKNNQAFEARADQRQANQDMLGNMQEIVESIRESAANVGQGNEESRSIARESIEQNRAHHQQLSEMQQGQQARAVARIQERMQRAREVGRRRDAAAAESARRRDAAAAERARRQDKAAAEAASRQDKAATISATEHEEMMAALSKTYPILGEDAVLPWSSYGEFWGCVGGVSQEHQDVVTESVPRFRDLMCMARDKNVQATLKDAGIPGLVAVRIAHKTHVNVYGK